jgi:hypothetical protein
LKKAVQDYDQNSVSISLVKTTDGIANQNLNELDLSFMYTRILKEILLSIDFEQEHMNEILTYCREHFVSSAFELKSIDKLEKEYRTRFLALARSNKSMKMIDGGRQISLWQCSMPITTANLTFLSQTILLITLAFC